jgi:Zn-dependent M28 family amino/carboxypeptidase
MTTTPGRSHVGPLPELTVEETEVRDRLKEHVETLAGAIGERNAYAFGYAQLQDAAAYIREQFERSGYTVEEQVFSVLKNDARNIEAALKGTSLADEILIVGAHYDSVIGCPGANDNASGIAGILEVARLLADHAPARTVRFVAFVNEEPPFFQTDDMGSLVYAKRCRQREENIVGMISLETIGYYSDREGSQQYPAPFNLYYPSVGDFIGFVGNLKSRSFVHKAIALFRNHAAFPSEGVAAPSFLPGIGWSDHWSFWQQEYPALMVTDTAPFRYPHYHTAEDTPDKIDYERTARVVVGLAQVASRLASENESAAGRTAP